MKITVVTDLHIGVTPKKIIKFGKFIDELDTDILLITGDINTNKQREIEEAFVAIRQHKPYMKVLVVFGNHDVWDSGFDSMVQIKDHHEMLCNKYNIHYLHNNKYEDDTVVIWGFDGWYRMANPGTNDEHWMPLNSGTGALTSIQYMWRREGKALDYILNDLEKDEYINTSKTKIVATHFNVTVDDFSQYENMSGNLNIPMLLCKDIDYLFYGHTHEAKVEEIDECKLINVGANYCSSPNKNNKYWKTFEF